MTLITPTLPNDSQIKYAMTQWGPIYEAVLGILGTTGTILPLIDPAHGGPGAATFKTVGEEQVVFTWSEPPKDFATAPSFQGIFPVVTFDGVDEEAYTPDADYWSRDDSAGQGMTIGTWVNLTDATSSNIIAKWTALEREYLFTTESDDKLYLTLRDKSAAVSINRASNSSLSEDIWLFLVATYDGRGGDDAADGITLYQNGVVFPSAATNNGAYVAMEPLTAVVDLGSRGGIGDFFTGSMAGGPAGPFFTQIELSADAIKRLYNIGRAGLYL